MANTQESCGVLRIYLSGVTQKCQNPQITRNIFTRTGAPPGMAEGRSMARKSHKIMVRALNGDRENRFLLCPDAPERAEIAALLGLEGLGKLRFEGVILPEGDTDWRLEGKLGATVRQACIITAEPVSTRIDTPVTRRLIAMPSGGLPDSPTPPEGDEEVQFDGDDGWDPLGRDIDLDAIMVESLALAIPEYPRASGANLKKAAFSPPGAAPIDTETIKPFASLAALRDKLKE